MATNCDITNGRIEPCKSSVGGVNALYFMNWQPNVTVDVSTEEVTDIDDGEETPGAVTAYKWAVKEATNLEETINSSRETGTSFWSQVINATFKKLDPETRKELKLATYGRLVVVVADNNGNALLCGKDRGMEVTGGTIVTGTAMGDLSGQTLIQTGEEAQPAYFLQGSTLEDPFAGMTTPPIIIDGSVVV